MRAIVTGANGLVGYAASTRLLKDGWEVVGIDNDSRASFFGTGASTAAMGEALAKWPHYKQLYLSVASARSDWPKFFRGVRLVIHCAAQPSHDWATKHIRQDFAVNAIGTLNMLEAYREACPAAWFIHVSTSKVYGDNPNRLEFKELEKRWEPVDEAYADGFAETFPVDHCLHSFFGVSKLSGDLLAQEYGRHFGLNVGIFRPGCVTGGHHKAAELHGFLAYLMRCVKHGLPYKVIGYQGKQVRCNVHADDLVEAMLCYMARPMPGAVYNIGGRGLDCSILEAIEECERRCGRKAITEYVPVPRTGDHIWYVSDTRKLQRDLGWHPRRSLKSIFDELWEMS